MIFLKSNDIILLNKEGKKMKSILWPTWILTVEKFANNFVIADLDGRLTILSSKDLRTLKQHHFLKSKL